MKDHLEMKPLEHHLEAIEDIVWTLEKDLGDLRCDMALLESDRDFWKDTAQNYRRELEGYE